MQTSFFQLPVATPDGHFLALYSDKGLVSLAFPASGTKPSPKTSKTEIPAKVRQWHRTTETAVRSVLACRKPAALPPLALSCGTAFQQAVWQALTTIPPGKTRTYLDIARAVRRPKAARAVGQACGANPIPVLIPCHRVVASGGGLGGFSGGLDWKKKLLTREGSLPG